MPYLHYQPDGAGAAERLLQEKIGEVASVLDYGAAGDGESDDSAAIQAAIDANQGGTILLPQGYAFFAAGILLSGSEYDGTSIRIEGTFLLKPFAAAVPSDGYWTQGEFVHNATPSIISGKVLLGWSRLTSGNAHSGGTDWTPAYAATS